MKDTAKKKDGSRRTRHIGQFALVAMFEARATLYETVVQAVQARMGVLAAIARGGSDAPVRAPKSTTPIA
jgi:hypothetical protein